MKLYPIYVLAHEHERFPPNFYDAAMAAKPAGLVWYAFDVIINQYADEILNAQHS